MTRLASAIYKHVTKRRGSVVNTPVSYSGGPGLNLGPNTGYPEIFRGSTQSFQSNARTEP
jgi:hypothetical protein